MSDFEQFAKAIMRSWPEGDVDGFELQDLAVKHGLLKMVPYSPDIHGSSEWDADPGDDWYVLTYTDKEGLKE